MGRAVVIDRDVQIGAGVHPLGVDGRIVRLHGVESSHRDGPRRERVGCVVDRREQVGSRVGDGGSIDAPQQILL